MLGGRWIEDDGSEARDRTAADGRDAKPSQRLRQAEGWGRWEVEVRASEAEADAGVESVSLAGDLRNKYAQQLAPTDRGRSEKRCQRDWI